MIVCSSRDGCRTLTICVAGCPCPEFEIPPRTFDDVEAKRLHLHKGCRVYHDGAVCPVPPAQPALPFDEGAPR